MATLPPPPIPSDRSVRPNRPIGGGGGYFLPFSPGPGSPGTTGGTPKDAEGDGGVLGTSPGTYLVPEDPDPGDEDGGGGDRSIVQSDEKLVISASWAKDDDITRLLKSLPNWLNMTQPKQLRPKREDEEDFIRAAFAKESEVLIGNLGDKLIPQNEIMTDVSDLKALANLHESLEWLAGRLKCAISNLPSAQKMSPGADSLSSVDIPAVSEIIVQTLNELANSFQDMSDRCLLVLHLEVRVHCFHYLIPLAKQGNYAIVANVESMNYDPLIVRLNKDISGIEEAMGASLQQHKFQYIFEGLGHLISCILINGAQYFKRISESGIKKMCRNIFVLQQNLTNITMSREADLDFARLSGD